MSRICLLGLAAVFLLMNNLFVYLFSPEYGVGLYGSRTVLLTIAGSYTITLQQLFYHFNMTLKVICVVPVALLFIACTDPSEFAASLASIGVSYRIGYSVSLKTNKQINYSSAEKRLPVPERNSLPESVLC